MTLDRDNYFLTFRFVFITIFISFSTYFGNLLIAHTFNLRIDNSFVYTTGIIVFILIQFFITHSIEINDKSILLKNLFGIKIKEIKKNSIKGRKVKSNSNYNNILLKEKYNEFIKVKYDLDSRNYSINGHILSNKGLKMLLTKTKK